MKFCKIEIDGYGRFGPRELDVACGLQVVVGPNEQGKSTLRNFITDMLYGQKRSAVQRVYEDSNELRRPWDHPDAYGGRLLYQLDDGREIEVYRRFDKKNETVQVYDRSHAREITGDFEQLRNREPLFAQAHIGLSKDVFLSTATISHLSLENLGSGDALAQIREKLLSLADSGEETNSADAALRLLDARIAAIGQPAARTRPLPAARAQLVELNAEYERAAATRRELGEIEERRRAILEEIESIRAQRQALEADLETLEKVERAQRLIDAEGISARINEATQRCFALSAVREFPLEQEPEVRRAEMVVTSARDQLERTRQEQAQLRQQYGAEVQRLGDAALLSTQEIPEEYDTRLADIEEKVKERRVRIEEVEGMRAAAETRSNNAQQELGAVPDFSRLADDPVTWVNQLANSFRIAVGHRDRECKERDVLREQVQRQRAIVAETEGLFTECPDFVTRAREYEIETRMRDEQVSQLRSAAEMYQASVAEFTERIPFYRVISFVLPAVALGFVIVALALHNPGIYIVAVMVGLVWFYFLGSWLYVQSQATRANGQLGDTQDKIAGLQAELDAVSPLEAMMTQAGCQTVRELEAKHERYRADSFELASLEKALDTQEAKAREAEQRVSQLFERFRRTFREMGEELTAESQVEEAAGRATARYQEYRDAKRRLAENRDQLKRFEAEAARVKGELEACRKEEVTLALDVRRLMRDNGYTEENKHDKALSALRSYRIRNAQQREKRGRIDVVQEKAEAIEGRREAEERDLEAHTAALSKYLAAANVESIEQWRQRAEQAKEFREARQRITGFQEQVNAVLRGQDLEDLRAAVDADGPLPFVPQRTPEAIKRDRERLSDALDALMKEEHALHLLMTERTAGIRSSNEIDEDRAVLERRIRDLDLELEAASYAMTLIDSIARDKHARIAPRLAAAASEFLRHITGGAYDELLINRELGISVRIPRIQRMRENPECVLSKGAVDQIYLALRLAMIQSLSENGESIPMILDDPFANYDDDRLERTLRLLVSLAERNQILLFTCREDVARAAEAVHAPILRL